MVTKLKPDKTYLITDAVTPTGTTMTEFSWTNKPLFVRNGRCTDSKGTLSGAFFTMNEAV